MPRDRETTNRARTADRRTSSRTEVLRRGKIVYGRDCRSMHCVVLDISDHGALLVPTDIATCPDRFSLEVAAQPIRQCIVVWREETYLGVKFA